MIVDFHTHTYPDKIVSKTLELLVSRSKTKPASDGTLAGLQHSMAQSGVDISVVLPVVTAPHQVERINTVAKTVTAQFTGSGVWSFGGIHPGNDNYKEILNGIKSAGLKGIKLHPDFQKFYIDDPAVYPLYEIIQETQLPILMHMGDPHQTYSQPQRLAKVLKEFPKLRVIAAHLGGWERWEEAVANLKADERLRFDTSSCSPFLPKDKMREIIRHYGAENCFFGVDFPMWDHEEELERFFALSLTDYENKRILSENLIEWIHQTNKK